MVKMSFIGMGILKTIKEKILGFIQKIKTVLLQGLKRLKKLIGKRNAKKTKRKNKKT